MDSRASEQAGAAGRPAGHAGWMNKDGHWAHHAVSLNTGQVISTTLAGLPTPESRAESLSRLRLPIGISIFSPPLYRVSVRAPYQDTPQAWLAGTGIDQLVPWSDYSAPDGQQHGLIAFLPPRDWAPEPGSLRALYFSFAELPPFDYVVLSIPLAGGSWPGAAGLVSLGYVELGQEQGPLSGQVQVELTDNGVHWLDVVYAPETEIQPEFVLNIGAGLEAVIFSYATLGVPPVFEPVSGQASQLLG